MVLKIFTKSNCPNCPPAKKLGKELEKEKMENLKVEWYDVEDVDGLAEGAFYSVMSTPSLVLIDGERNEVESWRGKAPKKEEVLEKLS